MKSALLFLLAFPCLAVPAAAQVWGHNVLDINSVRAGVNSNGDLFWNYSTKEYEVPAGGGAGTIFAGTLWIGGLDTSRQLHLAAQTYRQSGNDFFNGPVMNASAYSPANDALWAQVWKINKTTIDTFLMWHTNPGLYPGYTIPAVIQNWPANGNTSMGQAAQLAPYFDMNTDGTYNPNDGDYPCIKGDQAIFFIFNDDRAAHTETGGQKFGIELHGMLYAYKAPGSWLDSTVFLNYRLYNRTNSDFNDLYLGSWTDFDIGAYDDDYIGCDVPRNLYYGYNGDPNDGPSATATAGTYGAHPPAQGVLFLRGPEAAPNDGLDNDHDGTIDEPNEFCTMNRFVYYNNDISVTGNPATAADYYKYMSGHWLDNSPVTYGGNGYGGTTACNYMYPGDTDPDNLTLWSEQSVGNTPFDRRGLGVSGPFLLPAHKEMCIDFAYVFGRDSSNGVARMRTLADSATAFYALTQPCICTGNPLAVHDPQQPLVQLYPNPASDHVTIAWQPQSAGARVEVYDVNGKIVYVQTLGRTETDIPVSGMARGIYLVRIIDGKTTATTKLIRE